MEHNDSLEGKMFYGWLNNLAMYGQQLADLKQTLNHANYKGLHTDASIELDALKELIFTQINEVDVLTSEVMKRLGQLGPVNEYSQTVIPFTQLIRNNHLREQIRKVERSVFYLKYHVNKLLSIAS
jgi:hypothetical protein